MMYPPIAQKEIKSLSRGRILSSFNGNNFSPNGGSRRFTGVCVALWSLTCCAFGIIFGIQYGLHATASTNLFDLGLTMTWNCPNSVLDHHKFSMNAPVGKRDSSPTSLSYHYKASQTKDYFRTVVNPKNPRERPIVEPLPVGSPSEPTAALCTIIKGSERYLNEWLDYNVAIGFSAIYLYDNYDTPSLESWLNENRPGGHSSWSQYITVYHWPGSAQQMPTIRDCTLVTKSRNHTWTAFYDDDEYMVLKKHQNVVEYLAEYLPSGSININWQLYGPEDPTDTSYGNMTLEEIQELKEGQVAFHSQRLSHKLGLPMPLIQRNQHMLQFPTHLNGKEAISSKVIVHLDSFVQWPKNFPHIVEVKPGTKNWNSEGMELDLTSPQPWRVYSTGEVAALHHYRFRSVPEYLYKSCSRGRPDSNDVKQTKDYCRSAVQIMKKQLFQLREVWDDSAWAMLKAKVPWYQQFEKLG
ncbi:glycosyl transferase family 2 protein [Nitzschia inconspicua]|uniref:Glycosyl transferase family 2 protein n=1 Tax=Nitzschia inconspicua TaxID=303405 RepID=A0A9K3KGI9_9STRA|nr:glycosyl transferase family 2 protein [Nitzschia inconspicua]